MLFNRDCGWWWWSKFVPREECPARRRPWYIDFRTDPWRQSVLQWTKNIIFETRTESEPEVYWELKWVAVWLFFPGPLSCNYPKWWAKNKGYYEKMQAEFGFEPLTLRPGRSSVAQKPRDIAITDCTKETLLATKGFLAMLLHWATSKRIRNGRDRNAKAILKDILRRVLKPIKKKDKMWRFFARGRIAADTRDPDLHENVAKVAETHVDVADSLMFLFANRKKNPSNLACFVHRLHILESRMNQVILNSQVGEPHLEVDQPVRSPSKRISL